jgi:hypothetical protein
MKKSLFNKIFAAIVIIGFTSLVILVHYKQNAFVCTQYYYGSPFSTEETSDECQWYFYGKQMCLCNGELLPLNNTMIEQRNSMFRQEFNKNYESRITTINISKYFNASKK